MVKIKNETPTPTPTSTSTLKIIEQKTDGMDSMLSGFQVIDDEGLNIVVDKIKQIKTLLKFIEQEKDKFVAPAKAIIAEAKEKYDGYINKCKNAEITLKERAKKFMIEKEAKRIEEEKKLASKVESGYMKSETAATKLETLPEIPKTVRTDIGSGLRMSKRRVAIITDPNLIPKEYWIIDEIRVKREALEKDKNCQNQIPGVIIKEETSLSSI